MQVVATYQVEITAQLNMNKNSYFNTAENQSCQKALKIPTGNSQSGFDMR